MPEEYRIARISVKDEETQEVSPVDVRTRAEAVAVGDTTADEKFTALDEHLANLAIHSDAYVKTMWQITIPTTSWIQEGPEEADFPYSLQIDYNGVLDTHNAEVTVDKESIQVAAECGLCPTMETLHNGLKFWSRTIPKSQILCHMTLFGNGGISGGNT